MAKKVAKKKATVMSLFSTSQVPASSQISCIKAMYAVYANVVATLPDDASEITCFFMWWEMVCCGFCKKHNHWTNDVFQPDDHAAKKVHDTIFETLERIHRIDNVDCQQAALHGMGHLHHANVAPYVQRIIDDTRIGTWWECMGEWLGQCRDGTVM